MLVLSSCRALLAYLAPISIFQRYVCPELWRPSIPFMTAFIIIPRRSDWRILPCSSCIQVLAPHN
ncbi:hypothetical protein M413DRAFT_244050 [Hebeloma cylindrosporum]|uniref:Uncharacterized protein n=1 Tax=Hebeloma cylindrosporum TaxID=76867 RepID=A0A0C3C4U3_HEBCY|nr:hypothetical protein M413DRAFT_244050 [Hebeloma cylindrosporum h7]